MSWLSPGLWWEQDPECRHSSDQEAIKPRNPRQRARKGESKELERQAEGWECFLFKNSGRFEGGLKIFGGH